MAVLRSLTSPISCMGPGTAQFQALRIVQLQATYQILQARKGRQTLAFYTMPEYEMWKDTTNTSGWDIKYYKGLGTSTREEAKEYFADIEEHRKTFVWASEPSALGVLQHRCVQNSLLANASLFTAHATANCCCYL